MYKPLPLFHRDKCQGHRGQLQEQHKGSCRLFQQLPSLTDLQVEGGGVFWGQGHPWGSRDYLARHEDGPARLGINCCSWMWCVSPSWIKCSGWRGSMAMDYHVNPFWKTPPSCCACKLLCRDALVQSKQCGPAEKGYNK